jgi:predicted nucleic acid-binding protein
MRTAIDSSVLILLARKQTGWESWRDCVQAAANEGELIISSVAFAEYSLAYISAESALADLKRLHIYYEPILPTSAFLAGQIFLRYRREGGPRMHLIPDFLIAAHAVTQADRLAALDRGYLRSYFPALSIMAPLI